MTAELQNLLLGGWNLQVRKPADPPKRVIFLIHGWTGDENSMWVFAPQLPKDALLIAPRAPFASKHPELAGYSWVKERGESFSKAEQFDTAIDSFEKLLPDLAKHFSIDLETFGMMGFSQGAAFSVAYALRHSDRVNKLAMLAGFLPPEIDLGNKLAGKPIFIAHGTKDETVPVAMAHDAREKLEAAGAKVKYCESEIGHKLGANCFRVLREFFEK